MSDKQNKKWPETRDVGSGSGFIKGKFKHWGDKFSPKKSVKSFRDLDVYRISMELSLDVSKFIIPALEEEGYPLIEGMRNSSLSIPLFIADAHSIRFADFDKGVATLERAMQSCNKMVVYLEQSMGLYTKEVDVVLVEDLMKKYITVRGKMFRLMKAWKAWQATKRNY